MSNKFESLLNYKIANDTIQKKICGGALCVLEVQEPTSAYGGDTLHTQYINREDGKGYVVSGYHTTRGGYSSEC